ncbi:MAG: SgcJ/EcaC family oxidoreductase [Patescibacteria group bacterium]
MREKFKDISQSPEDQEKKLAQENFNNWNEALLTGDPKKVAALYYEDTTFLPTLSEEFKIGQKGTEEYFKHFLEKNPSGEIIKDEVQTISPDNYIHSGMYNFEVGPEGKRETVEARFTFVWQKDKSGEWKIIHHHSSVKPKS